MSIEASPNATILVVSYSSLVSDLVPQEREGNVLHPLEPQWLHTCRLPALYPSTSEPMQGRYMGISEIVPRCTIEPRGRILLWRSMAMHLVPERR